MKLCRGRQRKVGDKLLLQSLNLESQDIFAEDFKLLKVTKFAKLPPNKSSNSLTKIFLMVSYIGHS